MALPASITASLRVGWEAVWGGCLSPFFFPPRDAACPLRVSYEVGEALPRCSLISQAPPPRRLPAARGLGPCSPGLPRPAVVLQIPGARGLQEAGGAVQRGAWRKPSGAQRKGSLFPERLGQ